MVSSIIDFPECNTSFIEQDDTCQSTSIYPKSLDSRLCDGLTTSSSPDSDSCFTNISNMSAWNKAKCFSESVLYCSPFYRLEALHHRLCPLRTSLNFPRLPILQTVNSYREIALTTVSHTLLAGNNRKEVKGENAGHHSDIVPRITLSLALGYQIRKLMRTQREQSTNPTLEELSKTTLSYLIL